MGEKEWSDMIPSMAESLLYPSKGYVHPLIKPLNTPSPPQSLLFASNDPNVVSQAYIEAMYLMYLITRHRNIAPAAILAKLSHIIKTLAKCMKGEEKYDSAIINKHLEELSGFRDGLLLDWSARGSRQAVWNRLRCQQEIWSMKFNFPGGISEEFEKKIKTFEQTMKATPKADIKTFLLKSGYDSCCGLWGLIKNDNRTGKIWEVVLTRILIPRDPEFVFEVYHFVAPSLPRPKAKEHEALFAAICYTGGQYTLRSPLGNCLKITSFNPTIRIKVEDRGALIKLIMDPKVLPMVLSLLGVSPSSASSFAVGLGSQSPVERAKIDEWLAKCSQSMEELRESHGEIKCQIYDCAELIADKMKYWEVASQGDFANVVSSIDEYLKITEDFSNTLSAGLSKLYDNWSKPGYTAYAEVMTRLKVLRKEISDNSNFKLVCRRMNIECIVTIIYCEGEYRVCPVFRQINTSPSTYIMPKITDDSVRILRRPDISNNDIDVLMDESHSFEYYPRESVVRINHSGREVVFVTGECNWLLRTRSFIAVQSREYKTTETFLELGKWRKRESVQIGAMRRNRALLEQAIRISESEPLSLIPNRHPPQIPNPGVAGAMMDNPAHIKRSVQSWGSDIVLRISQLPLGVVVPIRHPIADANMDNMFGVNAPLHGVGVNVRGAFPQFFIFVFNTATNVSEWISSDAAMPVNSEAWTLRGKPIIRISDVIVIVIHGSVMCVSEPQFDDVKRLAMIFDLFRTANPEELLVPRVNVPQKMDELRLRCMADGNLRAMFETASFKTLNENALVRTLLGEQNVKEVVVGVLVEMYKRILESRFSEYTKLAMGKIVIQFYTVIMIDGDRMCFKDLQDIESQLSKVISGHSCKETSRASVISDAKMREQDLSIEIRMSEIRYKVQANYERINFLMQSRSDPRISTENLRTPEAGKVRDGMDREVCDAFGTIQENWCALCHMMRGAGGMPTLKTDGGAISWAWVWMPHEDKVRRDLTRLSDKLAALVFGECIYAAELTIDIYNNSNHALYPALMKKLEPLVIHISDPAARTIAIQDICAENSRLILPSAEALAGSNKLIFQREYESLVFGDGAHIKLYDMKNFTCPGQLSPEFSKFSDPVDPVDFYIDQLESGLSPESYNKMSQLRSKYENPYKDRRIDSRSHQDRERHGPNIDSHDRDVD